MQRALKHLLEGLIVGTGLAPALIQRSSPTIAVLAYHNVLPADNSVVGDAGLHLDQARFAAQLDRLCETHDVVALEDVFSDWTEDDRPKAVLTFDDAYVGALTVGLEEVTARGLSATVFVAPGLLGAEGFWWDLLAPRGGDPLPLGVRERALGSYEGDQDRVLRWALSEGLPMTPVPAEAQPADAALLRHAAALPGVTMASHTWGHPNLRALSAARCREEIERGHVGLKEILGDVGTLIDWLAYPYGLESPAVVEAASDIVVGATLVTGGLARRRGRPDPHPLRVPRVNVPRGLSADGLTLRLAGLVGS